MCSDIVWSIVFVLLTGSVQIVKGRGRMMNPPQRSSLWRFTEWRGKPMVATNTEDNGLNCGGYWKLHEINMHQCGVCGDPYDDKKRPNEAGGRYGLGIIVRTYKQSDLFINVTIDITANIGGYFEFRICPNNDIKRTVQQSCLDKYPLIINGHGLRYYPNGDGLVNLKVKIPEDMTCHQCVLQWKWKGSYYWGVCGDGYGGIGCGDQEEYYNCADIAILPSNLRNNGSTSTPTEPTEEYWPENIPPEVTQSTTSASTTTTEYAVATPDWLWRLLSVINSQKEKTTRLPYPLTASPGTTRFPPPPTIAPKLPHLREIEVRTPSISQIGKTKPYWSTLAQLTTMSSPSIGPAPLTTATFLSTRTLTTTNKTTQTDDVTSIGNVTTATKGPITASTLHPSNAPSTQNTSKPTSEASNDVDALSAATVTFESTPVASKMIHHPVRTTSTRRSNNTPTVSAPQEQNLMLETTRTNLTSSHVTNISNEANTTAYDGIQSVRQNDSNVQTNNTQLFIGDQHDVTGGLNTTSNTYLNATYFKFNETTVINNDYLRTNKTQLIVNANENSENYSRTLTGNTFRTKNIIMIERNSSQSDANETSDLGADSVIRNLSKVTTGNTSVSFTASYNDNKTFPIADPNGNITGYGISPAVIFNQSVSISTTNRSSEQNVTITISLNINSDKVTVGDGELLPKETTMPPIVPGEDWKMWTNDNVFKTLSTTESYIQQNMSTTTPKSVDINTTAVTSQATANNSNMSITPSSTPVYRSTIMLSSKDALNVTSSPDIWNVTTVSSTSDNASLDTTVSSVTEPKHGNKKIDNNSTTYNIGTTTSSAISNTVSTTDNTRETTTTLSPIDELALRGPLLMDDDIFGLGDIFQSDVDLQIDSPLADSAFVAMADNMFPVFESTTKIPDIFVSETKDKSTLLTISNETVNTGTRLSNKTTTDPVAGRVDRTQTPSRPTFSVDGVDTSTTTKSVLPVAEALISNTLNPISNALLEKEPFVELGQSQGVGIPILFQDNTVQSSTASPTVSVTSSLTTKQNSGVTEPKLSPEGVLLTNSQSIVSGLDFVETNLKVGGNRNALRSSGFHIGGNPSHEMEGDSVIVANFIDNSVLRSTGFGDDSETVNKKANKKSQKDAILSKDTIQKFAGSVDTSIKAVNMDSASDKISTNISTGQNRKGIHTQTNTIGADAVSENRHSNMLHADKDLQSGTDVQAVAVSNVEQTAITWEDPRAGQDRQSATTIQPGRDGLSHLSGVTDVSASQLMNAPPSVPPTLNVKPGSILDALLGHTSAANAESPSVPDIQNNVLPGENVPKTTEKEAEQPPTDRAIRWLH